MRCNPWRWLWGLPLLVMLTWITLLLEKDRIQADLSERSLAALNDAGMGWAFAAYDGRDAKLSGRALAEGQPVDATEIVRGVWGVRVVDSDIDLLDQVKDFIWSASLDGGTLKLAGFVPDDAVRRTVLSTAKDKHPDVRLIDEMQLARGAPDEGYWTKGVGFGLEQLAVLNNGRAELNGLGLSIAGEAPTTAAFKTVKRALRGEIPYKVQLVSDEVLPPLANPFTWSANRSTRQLVVSGYVPSEEVREELFAHAKELFPNLAIIDRTETARGVPEGWVQAARTVLDQLALLDTGTASLEGSKLTLSGEAKDQADAERIRKRLGVATPIGFVANADLTYPEPAPPTVSPYLTKMEADEEAVQLTGYVPDEAARVQLLEKAKADFPGRRIFDGLTLGSGQPDTWSQCVRAGQFGLKALGNGQFVVEDSRLSVSGTSDDERLAQSLPADVRAQANRACQSRVRVALDVPPEPDLTWRAIHGGEGEIVLDGEVPDAETQAILVKEAGKLFPQARIVDRMTVVLGYPRKWRSVALDGLKLLTRLRSGEAVINGQDLMIRGEAKDTAVAAALKDQLKHTLAAGYTGRNIIEVRSDAMIWAELEAKRKAQKNTENKQAAEREARARAEVERKAENDRRIREAARLRLEAEEAVQREAREAELFQREVEAKRREAAAARAADQERRARLSRLRNMDAREETARRAKADACQSLLRSTAREGSILFEFASAELDRSSFNTLDRLVEVANACPSFRIEIEGHTDAEGSPSSNKVLSERRARSVVTYLTGAGIPAKRLSAVGYGETRPVAPNDTVENRARNRRIEFAVKVE